MSNLLKQQFRQGVAAGIKRRTLTSCSKWSLEVIVMGKPFPGPLTFRHHPWLREMHDSTATWNVGQKAAQMGYSTAVINRTFFEIDIHRNNVLYLLPTKTPDATDFSVTRFDPALEASKYLEALFSDVKNVGVKRAGSATLYIRGANSRSGLKSIPASFIVFDEYDEMPEDMIALAKERTSGQLDKNFWAISTPTIPGEGINKLFLESTQEHWTFPCPICSKFTELIYPDSFVLCGDSLQDPGLKESHLICTECKKKLDHKAKPDFLGKGFWVPKGHQDMDNRGFYINQLYSPTISPFELAQSVIKSKTNLHDEQELFNSKLGLPHLVDGARVNDVEINECISSHSKQDKPRTWKIVTMGVDVGKWLHIEIDGWAVSTFGRDLNVGSTPTVLWEGTKKDFKELDALMKEWGVFLCVCDVQPETRMALEFAKRMHPRVKLCRYSNGIGSNKDVKATATGENSYFISVDRTTWLDVSLGRFHNQSIKLPRDVSLEYREHIKAPTRVYKMDKSNNPIGVYKEGSNADHFAHARNYAEIALPVAASVMSNSDIGRYL